VHGPHRHRIDRWCELARLLNDLPHQGEIDRWRIGPPRIVNIGWQLAFSGDCTYKNVHIPISTEGAHIVRQIPGLLRLEDIRKRRHGRAAEPRHKGAKDVLMSTSATEIPALGEICRPDRMTPIILQIGE
jgi:hypothetical protein